MENLKCCPIPRPARLLLWHFPSGGGTFGRQIKAARLFGGLSGPYRKAWWGIHPPPPGRPPTHGVAGIPQSPGGLYLGFHIGGGAT